MKRRRGEVCTGSGVLEHGGTRDMHGGAPGMYTVGRGMCTRWGVGVNI